MTGPASDAAGRESAVAELSAPPPPAFLDFLAHLQSRWWIVAATFAVCLAGACVYLAAVTPSYNVTAILMAEQPRGAADARGPSLGEFLNAQRQALLAPPVRTTEMVRFAPDIDTDAREGTITIRIQTDQPRAATAALSGMLDAYIKGAANQPSMIAQKLADLTAERDKLAVDRDAKTKALTDYRKQTNLSGTEADAVVHARRDQLAAALADAQSQAQKAQAEATAAGNLPSDPHQLAAVLEAARGKGAFKLLDEKRQLLKAQLDKYETALDTQKQTLLAQHPALVQTQKNVERAKAELAAVEQEYPPTYREFAQNQLAAAQKKVAELEALLAQQAQRSQQSNDGVKKIAELEAAVKQAEAALAAADAKIRQATLSSETTMRMNVVQPATAPQQPSYPSRKRTLAAAGAVGIVVGLALAMSGRR